MVHNENESIEDRFSLITGLSNNRTHSTHISKVSPSLFFTIFATSKPKYTSHLKMTSWGGGIFIFVNKTAPHT